MTIRDRVVELRRVKAADLVPNPKNWRTHPEGQAKAVSGILAEIGYADALIGRDVDGRVELLDGHLRRDLTPEAEVPVLIVDLDDNEADTLLASLDPLAGLAGRDDGKLVALIDSLTVTDPALASLLDELAKGAGLPPTDGLTDPEATPEPPDAARTQRGDVYQLGRHRLMCGDSASAADLDRLTDGNPIHLVNTDPPYNAKVEPRSNNAIAAGLSSREGAKNHQKFDVARHPGKSWKPTQKKLRAKDRPLENDFISDDAFDELLAAWFGNIARALEPGRAFYIWGGDANCANYPRPLADAGLYFSQAVIWVKQHPVLTCKDFMGDHEWCFYGWREGAAHKWHGPTNATDVWSIKKVPPQRTVHLTEKPVELAIRAMEYSSQRGENVLDLFGGSGSTLIAAEQTGRNAFLMEIDPLYCDVIVQRWEEFTGGKAITDANHK